MNKPTKQPLAFSILLLATLLISACQSVGTKQANHDTSIKNHSWTINNDYSTINIITTKNNAISEVSHFQSFSGTINEDLYLNIEIDLKSLETNIPIRNERIQKYLFASDAFPTADIHTQLKPEDLTPGVHNITFDVDMHGVSAILTAEFMVFEQFGNKIITLHKPLIINAKTFGFVEGIGVLKKLAHLDSINLTVPVNLTLTFEPQQ